MNKIKTMMVAAAMAASALGAWGAVPVAEGDALWLRYPAISPNGQNIAFSYMGDIYIAGADGGRARALTTNRAYDSRPIWSPDGSKIVFASDRMGNLDLYVVDAQGGEPKRITTNTAAEYPIAFLDGNTVLYKSSVMPDVADSQFPSAQFPQVWSVSLDGGRPQLFSSLTMENISIDPAGKRMLYHDKKGYEDEFRKHHQSSIARDVWMADPVNKPAEKRTYTKLTSFRGEDRNPVWAPGKDQYYYLSEQDGTFNVYLRSLDGKTETQLTDYKYHPVRFLTASNDGKICYSWNGEIYTLAPGGKPEKLEVTIVGDTFSPDEIARWNMGISGDIALNEKGKEIAFISRGDVFVTSLDYATTKRITDTPEQERNVDFSPDGRSIIYSSERDGKWGIYRTSLVRDDDKKFTYARELKEEPLIVEEKACFQPTFSPDGKEIAFLRDRTEVCVYNLESKKVRTVLPAEYNYSYTDGDQTYSWSPDSKWLLVEYIDRGGWNNHDIALVKADGSGDVTNLTMSGYSDGNPKWVLDGKAMIYTSDRAGYRSHGSWGAENDVYIMFFDGEAYDNFRLSKEERELAEAMKKESDDKKKDDDKDKDKDKDKKDKKGKKGKKDKKDESDDKKDDDKDKAKELKFDLDHRQDRIIRLTPNSSHLSDAVLAADGKKIYYTSAFEGGYDLWVRDLLDHSTRILIKGAGGGSLVPDEKINNLYLRGGYGIKKLDLGNSRSSNVDFETEHTYRPALERKYILDHVYSQVADKFYDPDIHGIDWAGYRDAYAAMLPHINNNYDFQELLSEMLGELNASHTGARFYGTVESSKVRNVAQLGAFFDESYTGDGLKVAEVIVNGPLDIAGSKVKAGSIITAINGQPVKAGEDYYPLLGGLAGKHTVLTVKNGGKVEEQIIKPTGSLNSQLYQRWIQSKRDMVEKLSDGRVGYIHIQGMDSPSFRKTFADLLGRYRNCEAVIIDTRHNGGGWLHEDLAILLSGQKFAQFMPRGQYVGDDPFNRWTKPSCVMVCEDNYSNAHGFPWTYKTLGLGKVIGAPVPGTMTAVWWETQLDPSLVFGVPQVGMIDMNGNYLENLELMPDIEIYNSPESQLSGDDPQLKAAVKEMLRQADEAKANAKPLTPKISTKPYAIRD